MTEFTKSERRMLRDLAGQVYEAEAGKMLGELEISFKEWRSGEKLSSELLDAIHHFHQHQSRELWSLYQGLKEEQIVPRGVALKLIDESQIDPGVLEKLRLRIDDYRRFLA